MTTKMRSPINERSSSFSTVALGGLMTSSITQTVVVVAAYHQTHISSIVPIVATT